MHTYPPTHAQLEVTLLISSAVLITLRRALAYTPSLTRTYIHVHIKHMQPHTYMHTHTEYTTNTPLPKIRDVPVCQETNLRMRAHVIIRFELKLQFFFLIFFFFVQIIKLGHELRALNVMQNMSVEQLHVPLFVVIDYRGFRVGEYILYIFFFKRITLKMFASERVHKLFLELYGKVPDLFWSGIFFP